MPKRGRPRKPPEERTQQLSFRLKRPVISVIKEFQKELKDCTNPGLLDRLSPAGVVELLVWHCKQEKDQGRLKIHELVSTNGR